MAGDSNNLPVWKSVEYRRAQDRRKQIKEVFASWQPPSGTVGLALSGGGIRSATFSLGLLRSLSRAKLIHSLDYLSTVSGGGYAGSFYSSLFVPQGLRGSAQGSTGAAGAKDQLMLLGEDVLGSQGGRHAIARLREGGHYLTPNGTSDAIFAGAIAIRNWLAVFLVTGLAVFGLLLAAILAEIALAPAVDDLVEDLVGKDFSMPVPRFLLWAFVAGALAFWPAACAWAFWFTRSSPVPRWRIARLFSLQTVIAAIIVFAALSWEQFDASEDWPDEVRRGIAAIAILSFATYCLAQFSFWRHEHGSADTTTLSPLADEDRVRSRLSRWLLRGCLVLLSALALFGILWLGREAALMVAGKKDHEGSFAIPGVLLAALPAIRWLLKREFVQGMAKPLLSVILRRSGRIAALVIGFALLIMFLVFWCALAHLVVWPNADPITIEIMRVEGIRLGIPPRHLVLFTGIVLLCAYLMGQVDPFLNRSSLASFYAARLRKAYLGATNRARWPTSLQQPEPEMPPGMMRRFMRVARNFFRSAVSRVGIRFSDETDSAETPVDEDHPFDDIRLRSYFHPSVLAPLHLINVTINETTSRSSRIIQRDRKGKSMTISCAGYIYPPRGPSEELAVIPHGKAEDLPLSSWIAISGAAFTTGAGQHTSLGTSLLAGMANMRLGYWWYSRPPSWLAQWRGPRKLVQAYLLREIWASYVGTEANRWYLSDGGHYENTGIYELVRRRVGFIIASDNGADPRYEFADLVNLIRKLRIDFGVEVEFLDDKELGALFKGSPLHEVFGPLERMSRRAKEAAKADSPADEPPPAPYATLARIRYPEEAGTVPAPSTLLLIKPRITGRELPNLLQYRDSDAAFPQQPTTDQFFDEAQWESYYRLGMLIGDAIFDAMRFGDATGRLQWAPWSLAPLPEAEHIRAPIRPPAAKTDEKRPQST